MTPVLSSIVNTAYVLLPSALNTPQATQMIYAIGWQESRFEQRVQVGGPARGFWQFERGGAVTGVLTHPKTRLLARRVLRTLRYTDLSSEVYEALAHNDVLAGC